MEFEIIQSKRPLRDGYESADENSARAKKKCFREIRTETAADDFVFPIKSSTPVHAQLTNTRKKKVPFGNLSNINNWPFACTEDDCQETFRTAQERSSHVRIAHMMEPIECPYPNCSFILKKINLHRHVRLQHDISEKISPPGVKLTKPRTLRCTKKNCGKTFKTTAERDLHSSKAHSAAATRGHTAKSTEACRKSSPKPSADRSAAPGFRQVKLKLGTLERSSGISTDGRNFPSIDSQPKQNDIGSSIYAKDGLRGPPKTKRLKTEQQSKCVVQSFSYDMVTGELTSSFMSSDDEEETDAQPQCLQEESVEFSIHDLSLLSQDSSENWLDSAYDLDGPIDSYSGDGYEITDLEMLIDKLANLSLIL